MLKIFELIGRYFILMGKVFSRPEKAAIYRRRIVYDENAAVEFILNIFFYLESREAGQVAGRVENLAFIGVDVSGRADAYARIRAGKREQIFYNGKKTISDAVESAGYVGRALCSRRNGSVFNNRTFYRCPADVDTDILHLIHQKPS